MLSQGRKKYRQAREGEGDTVERGGREKLLCYIKSFVMLGPTGQLVLSANIKKDNVLVLCYSNSLVLTSMAHAWQHSMKWLLFLEHHTGTQ